MRTKEFQMLMAIFPVKLFREVYILRLVVGGANIEAKAVAYNLLRAYLYDCSYCRIIFASGFGYYLNALDFRRSSSVASRI